MSQYKKNILLLILPALYINAVFAENDLIWDGRSEKASKYLFFAPTENGTEAVYQPKNAVLVKSNNSSNNSNNSSNNNSNNVVKPKPRNNFKTKKLNNNFKPSKPKINFDINMVRIFGGCLVNSQTLKADLLFSDKCVDDFYMSDSEITNAQYNKFLLDTGNSPKTGNEQNPVVNISWQDAVDFTQWISQKHQKNYTLPNSVQWQYAANTDGTSTQQDICNQSNAYACKEDVQSAIAVKSLAPNQWSLYDMYGNVWEWVINYDSSVQEKTAKGGSWSSADEIFDLNQKNTPNSKKSQEIGFRIIHTN